MGKLNTLHTLHIRDYEFACCAFFVVTYNKLNAGGTSSTNQNYVEYQWIIKLKNDTY
jgi:hypothetical protein